MRLDELNHWWVEKQVRKELVPVKHRELFNNIKADIGRKQIQVVAGLRRVGKSTIFYQLIR